MWSLEARCFEELIPVQLEFVMRASRNRAEGLRVPSKNSMSYPDELSKHDLGYHYVNCMNYRRNPDMNPKPKKN